MAPAIAVAAAIHDKYQLSLTNSRDALYHGNVLQTKVDAQCDKLATELN